MFKCYGLQSQKGSFSKCSKTAHTECCIQTTEVVTVVVTMIKLLFSGQLKCVSVSGIKDSGSQASTLSDSHRATQCTMCVAIISSHIILTSFYFLSLCNAISSSISYHHHRPVSAVSYYVLCLEYIYKHITSTSLKSLLTSTVLLRRLGLL